MSKDSAGLRVRSHPSLQSEQIGIVHVNGTITFIDEVIDLDPIISNAILHFCLNQKFKVILDPLMNSVYCFITSLNGNCSLFKAYKCVALTYFASYTCEAL